MNTMNFKPLFILIFSLFAIGAFAQSSLVSFTVIDSITRKPISKAEVHVIDTLFKSEIGVLTDTNGIARIKLPIGRAYRYFLSAFDHYDSREFLLIPDSFEKEITTSLQKFEFFACPVIEGVHFKKGEDIIDTTNQKQLDETIQYFKNQMFSLYPNGLLILKIDGHTRNGGNEKKNYELGLRRAEVVGAYLKKGLESNRCEIFAASAGSFYLVNGCGKKKCSEEEHQMNDRVTIRVLSFRK